MGSGVGRQRVFSVGRRAADSDLRRQDPQTAATPPVMITRKYLAIISAMGGVACYAVPDLPKRSLAVIEHAVRSTSALSPSAFPAPAAGGVPFPSTAQVAGVAGLPAGLTPSLMPAPPQATAPGQTTPAQTLVSAARETIQLGSLALAGWDERQLNNPVHAEALIDVIASLDAVVLQGIRAIDERFLQRVTDMLASRGKRFAYLADAGGGRPIELAIVFDVDVLQVDRSWSYRVSDPADVLSIDPLVGWFRTRCVAEERAWTFTLVAADFRRSSGDSELRHLDAVRQSIVDDGRGEDDLVLAAWIDPAAGQLDDRWQRLTDRADDAAALSPTHRDGAVIAIPAGLTGEWTYRGDRQRLVRRLNIYPEQAAAISPGDLVTGEFSAAEHRY